MKVNSVDQEYVQHKLDHNSNYENSAVSIQIIVNFFSESFQHTCFARFVRLAIVDITKDVEIRYLANAGALVGLFNNAQMLNHVLVHLWGVLAFLDVVGTRPDVRVIGCKSKVDQIARAGLSAKEVLSDGVSRVKFSQQSPIDVVEITPASHLVCDVCLVFYQSNVKVA